MKTAMRHWSEAYVGRPCGTRLGFDCADLARLVQKEVFGRNVAIPMSRAYTGKDGSEKVRAMMQQIGSLKNDFVVRVDKPQEGDGILLYVRKIPCHIGIFCSIGGRDWVLHAADMAVGPQVVLQLIGLLSIRGLSVEGYYRWI